MAALSDAIKDIDDPLRVASDLSKLFGKAWAEQLPALKRGFKELGDGTKVMSTDAVEAIDAVGDALTRAARNAKGDAAEAFYYLFVKGWGAPAREAKKTAEDLEKQIKSLTKAAQDARPDFGALVPPKLTPELDDVAAKLEKSAQKSIDFANAAKKAKEEAEKFANAVKSFSFGVFVADTSKLNAMIPDLSSHIEEMAEKFADVREHMDDLESSNISFNTATIETANGVSKLYTAFSTLPNVMSSIGEKNGELADAFAGLQKALDRIPELLIKSFTGGGGLTGAFKAIGTSIADAIVAPIAAGLSKVQKEAVAAGGALSGGLGAAAGVRGASAWRRLVSPERWRSVPQRRGLARPWSVWCCSSSTSPA